MLLLFPIACLVGAWHLLDPSVSYLNSLDEKETQTPAN